MKFERAKEAQPYQTLGVQLAWIITPLARFPGDAGDTEHFMRKNERILGKIVVQPPEY